MTPQLSPTSSPKSGSRPRGRTKGFAVIAWIEKNCVHTNGEWIGKPFRLLDWQKAFILRLFEVDPSGLRIKRWAYLSVAKKNGKTELAAALALYFLIGDGEPAPLVVCAAGSDEQADLVFGAARTMCEFSPTLSQITDCYDKEILVPSIPGAKLKRLAAVAGTNDGQNIFVVICDELHEWTGVKGENVHTVLTNGIIGRRQGMVLEITTAGSDKESICGRQYDYGRQVESGEIDDPQFLFECHEADPDDDYHLEETWKKANPSYGELVFKANFEDQLKRKTEASFRRYFCNQWTTGLEVWLPFGSWDGCANPRPKLGLDDECVLFFDGSYSGDATAIVACTLDGYLEVIDLWEKPYGDDEWRVDIGDVEERIRRACMELVVLEVACDPFRWQRSMQILENEGIPIVEYPTSSAQRMVSACAKFYDAVVDNKLTHDGDPNLARHVGNCVTKIDRLGPRVVKEHKMSKRRIDLAVCAIGAYDRATQQETGEGYIIRFDNEET